VGEFINTGSVDRHAKSRIHRVPLATSSAVSRGTAALPVQENARKSRSRLVGDGRVRELGPPLRLAPNLYLAHTQPGFEGVAWDEIEACVNAGGLATRELGRRHVPDRAGILIFTLSRPEPLRLLRASEDLFAVVGYRHGLTAGAVALERIAAVARDAPYVDQALAVRTRLKPGTRSGHRLRYRVIARMVGEHDFRRVDVANAVSRGIAERGDHNWRLSPEPADVEFWAMLFASELILTIRLSDETMRHRDYKVAHLPGSLRPSVAAALALLSQPAAEDVVFDPFCGAGTLLIERAHLGRYRLLIGCDRDEDALAAAQENAGPRYKPLEFHRWDATAVPLPDRSVDKIITNLPWGLRHGSHGENMRLYPFIFHEFHRLSAGGGKIVILTGETRLMSDLITKGLFRPDKILRVSILGANASVYVSNAPGQGTNKR
jgi:tRNA (guanine6-N2)-methyltransferase